MSREVQLPVQALHDLFCLRSLICLDSLEELFRGHGVKLVFDDKRIAPAGPSYSFQGSLRGAQQEAIDEILKHDLGVLSAPPGFGETVIGAHLIAKRGCSTLVLVHRKELLDQWIARLSLFLGIESKADRTDRDREEQAERDAAFMGCGPGITD